MTAATPRSCSIPQAAATSPNARWRVRSGRTAASRASSSAAMSAAVPRYRSETSFGLPSTQPISRRYQYGFPLITFLYRLAMALGHRPSDRRKQADTPDHRRSDLPYDGRQLIKIELARKLGLVPRVMDLLGIQWDTNRIRIVDFGGTAKNPALLARYAVEPVLRRDVTSGVALDRPLTRLLVMTG